MTNNSKESGTDDYTKDKGWIPVAECKIFAHIKWQSAMASLLKGKHYLVRAQGDWCVNPQHNKTYDADGYINIAPEGYVMPGMHEGALCARIGGGKPFLIGKRREFNAEMDGDIEFITNDHPEHQPPGGFSDNSGEMKVTVMMYRTI